MKKIISFILSLTIILSLFSVIPITVSAESNITETPQEEYIYYSDLFYGYSSYLDNNYLSEYKDSTQNIFNKVYADYMDSPYFMFSNIKNSLDVAFDIVEWTKLISDLTQLTSFTYEKALDKANADFASEVLGGNEIASSYGKSEKILKNINKVLKVYDTFEQNHSNFKLTEEEYIIEMFSIASEQKIFTYISVTQIQEFQEIFLPQIHDIVKSLDVGITVLDIAKSLIYAMMIEDMRIEAIEDIFSFQSRDTMLYDGMSRLRKQLKSGFVSYFYHNYIKNKLIERIADDIIKDALSDLVTSSTPVAYKLIKVTVKLASFVVFDVIINAADIDDLTKQMVLSEYSYQLYNLVKKQQKVFTKQFSVDDIKKFERIFDYYIAATDAAFSATDSIKLSSNREELEEIQNQYWHKDIYSDYVASVKREVKAIPKENRQITNFEEWRISTDIYLRGPSDKIEENSLYCIASGFKGNIVSTHALVYTQDEYHIVTIPENETFILCGDMDLESDLIIRGKLNINGKLLGEHIYNYGELSVNGKFESQYGDFNYGKINVKDFEVSRNFYNYGEINVSGNFTIRSSYGYFYMSNSGAVLRVGGDICFLQEKSSKISGGTVILNGLAQQNIEDFLAPVLIIDNTSEEGVQFKTKVNFSILFDHQGNNFSLNKGGTFVDYDGDGMNDNVDPHPTIGNSCIITVESNNLEYGTVSTESIETIGGTTHTISATPTFKYRFVKWIDSSGNTVSTSATYIFVAKNTTTLTAVFSKRLQPILKSAKGGVINAPSNGAIESEITVTVTENEGYVYKEGTLAYNGIPIENNTFIMPDEKVVLTAEFIYNENYFALKEKIEEVSAITYENYSVQSYNDLQTAITNAITVLKNDITAEASNQYIAELQNAVDNLTQRYITSIEVVSIPTLYIGIENTIDNIELNIVYDNGFKENTTDFTIENYDCNKLGIQNITISHKEFYTQVDVTVKQRNIWQTRYSSLQKQIYKGAGTVYEPKIELSYSSNGEKLIENIDYTLQYLNNSTPGTATIKITGIGNYTGTRQINFYIVCEHDYEIFEYVEPNCLQKGYYKERCCLCNELKTYYYSFYENLPESKHNYNNNTDITYTYSVEGAECLDLVFSSNTILEKNYDYIYIFDNSGTQIGKYTGTELTSKTVHIIGDTVKIKLTSDTSTVYYGFSLDSVTATYCCEILNTTNHTMGDWVIQKEPTVYAQGTKCQLCSVCGEIINQEFIDKLIFYGDANNDGEINSIDLANLRCVLLLNDTNYTNNIVCDSNGDGQIDIKDLVRLRKFLAGMDVLFGPENTETKTVEYIVETAYLEQKNTANHNLLTTN